MREAHKLKDNHGNEVMQRVIYFDVESRLIPDGEKVLHEPYLITSCFVDYRRKSESWREYYGTSGFIEEFWEDVIRFVKKGNNYMIAHNVSYDLIASKGLIHLFECGFQAVNYYENGKIFILKLVKKEGKNRKNIYIMSSTNYFAFSIKELGKTFGLPKMEIDYQNSPIEEVLPYCRRDVEIMKKAVEAFRSFVISENLGCQARTVAGQAFNAFRHRFMNTDIYIHDNMEACMLEREAYYGGRTEAWFLGKVPETVYKLDVNSMYPYVMREKRYPVKLISYSKYGTPDEVRDAMRAGYLVIAKCRIVTEKPIFPVRLNDNLIFPIGDFVTYLCTPEIDYAFMYGCLSDVYEYACYEGYPIFKKYVEYFYAKRLEAKQKKDKVMDMFYKLMLNSLYGKFGQRADVWERIGEADPYQVKVERIIDAETGEEYEIKVFGGSIFRKSDEVEAFNSFCAISAHVTAYARMLLWKYIEIAGENNVYYMDTDSLFVNQVGYENLIKSGSIDETRLGALKCEGISDNVIIYAPKDYQFEETRKMKGIPGNAEKIADNKYKVTAWPKLNTFLRTGILDRYYNKYLVKEQKYEQTKCWYSETGKSSPILLLYNEETGENEIQKPDIVLLNPEQIKHVSKKYRQIIDIDESVLDLEYEKMERDYMKKLRKAILNLGGIKDKTYENIPPYLKRKNGYGLDELVSELRTYGFVFESADELYEAIRR